MPAVRPPCLQRLVAAHGGYWAIDWPEYDAAVAAYQAGRRAEIRDEQYGARTTARAPIVRKVKRS
jgi:hypothetical protein